MISFEIIKEYLRISYKCISKLDPLVVAKREIWLSECSGKKYRRRNEEVGSREEHLHGWLGIKINEKTVSWY